VGIVWENLEQTSQIYVLVQQLELCLKLIRTQVD